MLCESGTVKHLDDPNWIAELKADGTRILLGKEDDDTYWIYNRKQIEYTNRLPELIDAAKSIPAGNFILDGEACWFDENGRTLFEGSQVRCSTENANKQRIAQLKYPIVMLAFDVLHVDGRNIENWPIEERKNLLDDLLKGTPPAIKSLPYTITGKRELYNELTARGEEGLIIKRLGSKYERRRSQNWLKVKRWYSERVKVVGYTEGTGKREKYFGSLILARPDDDGHLVYCGKVGSGFNDAEVKNIYKQLSAVKIEQKPVDTDDPYQPVKTPLEISVKFYETTSGGVFRFPSILKDNRGTNQIHYDGGTIDAKPKPRDLLDLFRQLK